MSRRLLCAICVICGLLFLGFTGCPQQDPYRKAAVAAADFAAALKTFQDSEIALHNSGSIDAETHKAIQSVLLDTARAGKQLDQAIRVAKSNPEAWTAVIAAVDALARLQSDGVLHIKNDKARQQLAASLALARSALGALQLALPAKGATP